MCHYHWHWIIISNFFQWDNEVEKEPWSDENKSAVYIITFINYIDSCSWTHGCSFYLNSCISNLLLVHFDSMFTSPFSSQVVNYALSVFCSTCVLTFSCCSNEALVSRNMFFASTAYGLQHLLQFPEIPKEPCLVMCTIMFDRKLIHIISFSWSSLGPITLVPFQFRNECSLLDSSFINDSHIQSLIITSCNASRISKNTKASTSL